MARRSLLIFSGLLLLLFLPSLAVAQGRTIVQGEACGGDLAGTFPACTVTDDSHAHGPGTIADLDASDTTTGTFADGRISQGSVTQHQGALSITESQVSDLDHLTPAEARTALQENGTAEMLGESLGTACLENQVWKANATGGVDCAADSTGSGLGTNLSSSTNEIVSDNGTVRQGSNQSAGNQELLDWDYETTADEVGVSSPSGVTKLNFDFIIGANGFEAAAADNGHTSYPPATAGESLWDTGPNHDGAGDDNDCYEVRQSLTPGTSVQMQVCPDGTGKLNGSPLHTNATLQSESFTILEPDAVQAIEDIVVLKVFDADAYPSGATVSDITISTSAACTDAVSLLERANSGTAWSTAGTIETITLSGTETTDDGTLTDDTIAAGNSVALDLADPTCDVGFMTVTITYTVL